MAASQTVLLIDAGAEPLDLLAVRIRRLGYRAVRAKTTEDAHNLLVDPRFAVGAAIIPPDLPALDLGGAVRALKRVAPLEDLPLLVHGPRPVAERRRELANAGVGFALWDPVDAHTLRFQINRALAGGLPPRAMRRALRAPACWRIDIQSGRRRKAARVYSVSARGAFLVSPVPSLRGTPVSFELPLEASAVCLKGRVTMTNVPGNLLKPSLPVGMGVAFQDTRDNSEALLQVYAEERMRALDV